MPLEKYVCVVGGSNIDMTGTPHSQLRLHDSNPGNITLSYGGAGRNIAENLSLLGINVDFISAFGADHNSNLIQENCRERNISITHCISSKSFTCPTFLCINSNEKDIHVAVSDMSCMSLVTPAYIKRRMPLINHAQACVIDTNLPRETIKYIISYCKTNIFLDTVSSTKTEVSKDVIKDIFAIKPNILEAEILSNQKISSLYDVKMAAKKILERNINNVFISMAEQGVYFDNGVDSGIIPPLKVDIKNTSGAGDSFISAIVWSYLTNRGFDIASAAKAGTAAAAICMQSPTSVNSKISTRKIKQLMGEMSL